MSYTRVIPRDLFNDANLLKCLGRFWILAENNIAIQIDHDCEPFDICQNENDGSTHQSPRIIPLLTFHAKIPPHPEKRQR